MKNYFLLSFLFFCTSVLVRGSDGYTLVAPTSSKETFLISKDGEIVHSWKSRYFAGRTAYLLDDGSILRGGSLRPRNFFRKLGGAAGYLEQLSWDGDVVWSYKVSTGGIVSHHDFEPMPNGNVLVLVWKYMSEKQALKVGRDPKTVSDHGLIVDTVLELKPILPNDAEVVWKWEVWDHLIQDFDPTKENFGNVSKHPEKININYGRTSTAHDWTHCNSIAYNSELDQIVLSVLGFNELWVIDHNLSIGQAKGARGDLLYRWGNPEAYQQGGPDDQMLFKQHDVTWIEKGSPGEGNFLIFNNGRGRPDISYSSVDEIMPPFDFEKNAYQLDHGAWGPSAPVWSYMKTEAPTEFYAGRISGAQRLPDGNTLVCSGPQGYLFEVDASGRVRWEWRYDGNDPSEKISNESSFSSRSIFKARRYESGHPGLGRLVDLPGKEE